MQKVEIQRELQKIELIGSNPEDCAQLIIDYARNISENWASTDYVQKQKFQNHVFPTGLKYCKEKGLVRTEEFNSIFLWIAGKQQDLGQKKCGIPSLNLDDAALVVPTRIELVSKV